MEDGRYCNVCEQKEENCTCLNPEFFEVKNGKVIDDDDDNDDEDDA